MSRKKSVLGIFIGLPGRIKKIRGNLTQVEFAKVLQVSQGTVNKYEKGLILAGEESLKKIASYGGVTVEWLLYGDKVTVLAQIRDEALELYLHPDTIPEVKNIAIRNYHQTAMALREQLDLKIAEIAELRQSGNQPPQLLEELLREIILSVDEWLNRRGLTLAAPQTAELVIALYRHFREKGGQVDKDMVERFFLQIVAINNAG